ncbi:MULTISPECIES: hypothetical protein [unclassified Wolbachia]|nr:hypothetical protein [Wolbachia endosymbiont (group A) of Apoderus coryli]
MSFLCYFQHLCATALTSSGMTSYYTAANRHTVTVSLDPANT